MNSIPQNIISTYFSGPSVEIKMALLREYPELAHYGKSLPYYMCAHGNQYIKLFEENGTIYMEHFTIAGRYFQYGLSDNLKLIGTLDLFSEEITPGQYYDKLSEFENICSRVANSIHSGFGAFDRGKSLGYIPEDL